MMFYYHSELLSDSIATDLSLFVREMDSSVCRPLLSASATSELDRLSRRVYELDPWRYISPDNGIFIADSLGKYSGAIFCRKVDGDYSLSVLRDFESCLYYLESLNHNNCPTASQYLSCLNSIQVRFTKTVGGGRPSVGWLSVRRKLSKVSGNFQAVSCLPGYLPWGLSEHEARLLSFSLKALIHLLECFDRRAFEARKNSILLRGQLTDNEYPVWLIERSTLEQVVKQTFNSRIFGDIPVRLDYYSKDSEAVWEVGQQYLKSPVYSHFRPHYPGLAAIVDHKSNKIIEVRLHGPDESAFDATFRTLLSGFQNLAIRPKMVLMSDPVLFKIISDPLRDLAISVLFKEELKQLLTVQRFMESRISAEADSELLKAYRLH